VKLNTEVIDSWFYRNLDTKNRTIYFGPWQVIEQLDLDLSTIWEVTDYSAQNLIKGLYLLENQSHENINIIWTSHGGEWDAGISIYDFIKNLKSFVTITCYGRARSMGSIILQSADERVLAPNCMTMIHYGNSAFDGHSKNVIIEAGEEERSNTTMENIYLEKIKQKHPNYTRKKLQEFMKYNRYLTPKEAIDLGLADKIQK